MDHTRKLAGGWRTPNYMLVIPEIDYATIIHMSKIDHNISKVHHSQNVTNIVLSRDGPRTQALWGALRASHKIESYILEYIVISETGKAKSRKLINNRPGYDMKYIKSYIYKYFGINDYQQFFDKLFEIERQYDTLSVIRPNETPQQWAIRVRVPLQELVSEKKRSVYHVHCLYGGFGNSKLVDHDYYRPRIHKTHMAICLDCWKLIQVNDVSLGS